MPEEINVGIGNSMYMVDDSWKMFEGDISILMYTHIDITECKS